MKSTIFRSVMLVLLVCMGAGFANAQKLTKEQKAAAKRVQMFEDSVKSAKALAAVKDQHFVLMADQIRVGKEGEVYDNLLSNSNYLYLTGDTAVIQIAPMDGSHGVNGLGGKTYSGKIGEVTIKEGKKNSRIKFVITGPGINSTVTMYLDKKTNDAEALVMPNGKNTQTIRSYRHITDSDMTLGTIPGSSSGSSQFVIYGKVEAYNGDDTTKVVKSMTYY